MIFRSKYWRRDLLRIGKDLNRWQAQRRWTESTHGNFEHAVMRGFYVVRKLLESQLVRVSKGRNLSLVKFPFRGGGRSHIIWLQLQNRYDLQTPRRIGKNIPFIANQFIHSYVFIPSFDRTTCLLSGVFFASDTESGVHVFWIPVAKIAEIFTTVAGARGMAFRVTPKVNRFLYP